MNPNATKAQGEIANKTEINIKKKKRPIPLRYLAAVLITAVFIRMIMNFLPCYKIDMGGYSNWSDYLAGKGFGGFDDFYRDVHCVYGPVYLYFLWVTGHIVDLFSLNQTGVEFFVKIWAAFSDIIGGCLIYFIGKRYNKEKLGLILGLLYVFNPAVFFNSSVWGQFDSFTATILLAVVYLFNLKKSTAAVFMYAVAALTKPQSIALLPLVVILYFRDFPWSMYGDYFKRKDKIALKRAGVMTLKKLGITLAGCLLIYAVFVFPFYRETPFYSIKDIEVYGFNEAGNLASGKNISVSGTEKMSSYASYAANNAIDGNEDTFWSSAHTNSQWMSLNLDRSIEISKVVLNWNWDYAKVCEVKVSDDSENWKTVYIEKKGKSGINTMEFDPVKARFIRLDFLERPFPYNLVKIDDKSGIIEKSAFKFIDFYYWLVHQYTSSLNDYPYATANAFNLWMVLGKQTVSDKEDFAFGVSSGLWGYIFLGIVSVFAVTLLLVRKKSLLALYYAGYFLTMGTFVFGTKMHERYMLPAITFAMICILWDKRMVIPTVLLSACSLANQWLVYYAGNKDSFSPWISPNDRWGMVIAWGTVLTALLSTGYIVWLTGRKTNTRMSAGSKAVKNNVI